MNIKILHRVKGAQQATGCVVIIDVFRAFSLEAYLISKGVTKIIPVSRTIEAIEYKKQDPNILLAGERYGKLIPGFDLANSPSQINVDVNGKVVVHTTSSGTQGIVNAIHADTILTGSLVNAKAIVKYIKDNKFEDISLVCMGILDEETDEDNLCASYIKNLLLGYDDDITSEIEKLKVTSGYRFFEKDLQESFPESDFYLCTDINKFNFVLKLEDGKYLKRIDV